MNLIFKLYASKGMTVNRDFLTRKIAYVKILVAIYWGRMPIMNRIEKSIEQVVDNILQDYSLGRDIDRMDSFSRPDKDVVIDIIHRCFR